MRRRVWIGFGVLCLLAGSRWLVEAAAPSMLAPGPRAALHGFLLAAVLGVTVLVRQGHVHRMVREERGLRLPRVAGLGALTFAVPGAVVAGASGRVAGLTEELVFLLLPVAVVFVASQSAGFGAGEDTGRLLGPALAGLAGAALLVPFTLPASVVGDFWLAGLVLAVVLAGCAAVRLHAEIGGMGVLRASVAIAAAGALVAAAGRGWGSMDGLGARDWGLEAAKALLLDGPVLLSSVWCVRELTPVRFSARVLVVLLVAIAESFAAAQPRGTWTMAAGAALMAGGAGWLLREGGAETD